MIIIWHECKGGTIGGKQQEGKENVMRSEHSLKHIAFMYENSIRKPTKSMK
jgi:hypothetical protein